MMPACFLDMVLDFGSLAGVKEGRRKKKNSRSFKKAKSAICYLLGLGWDWIGIGEERENKRVKKSLLYMAVSDMRTGDVLCKSGSFNEELWSEVMTLQVKNERPRPKNVMEEF